MIRVAQRIVPNNFQAPRLHEVPLPPDPPWEVAVPTGPPGRTALSVARNLQQSEPSHNADRGAGGAGR
eukprot:10901018-Alexandrium_andersonii.AAC.1